MGTTTRIGIWTAVIAASAGLHLAAFGLTGGPHDRLAGKPKRPQSLVEMTIAPPPPAHRTQPTRLDPTPRQPPPPARTAPGWDTARAATTDGGGRRPARARQSGYDGDRWCLSS